MIFFGLGHLALWAHLSVSSQLQRHRNLSGDEAHFSGATLPRTCVHKDLPQSARQAVLFPWSFRLSLISPNQQEDESFHMDQVELGTIINVFCTLVKDNERQFEFMYLGLTYDNIVLLHVTCLYIHVCAHITKLVKKEAMDMKKNRRDPWEVSEGGEGKGNYVITLYSLKIKFQNGC